MADEKIARQAAVYIRRFSRSHRFDIADALIAATAEVTGEPLATLNLKHFPMFPGLQRPY